MDTKNLLEVEKLSVTYKDRNGAPFNAVKGISFSLQKGHVLGLVGESGCGKTTTGRAIIGLNKISGGQIYFNGNLIASAAPTKEEKNLIKKVPVSEKTKIQMIFQDPVSSLDPRMTVREIIAEGLRIRGIKKEDEISEKVSKALSKVGLLSEYQNRYPHEFSGGQKQRIGIARAIIMEPELIIADEPVSALDVSIKAQITNLLDDLRKDMGLSIIFISHDLSIVKHFADTVAVMYFGHIVEMASAEVLFSNPLHPYTQALLSAIPIPDPKSERKRKRLFFTDVGSMEGKSLKEVAPNHYLLS